MRNEEQLGLIDVYLRERLGGREDTYTKRIRNRITQSVEHFAERGITWPNKADFEALRAWLSLKEGKPKGKPISAKTVSDWVCDTENYYNWLIQRRQANMFKDEQDVQEQAGMSTGEESATVIELQEDTHTLPVEALSLNEPVLEKSPNPYLSSLPPLNELMNEETHAPITEDEQPQPRAETKPKNKGGRKVIDPNGEKRSEKVMLYLTPSRMEDLRDLASLYGKSIADYVISLIESDNERKQEKLSLFRELRSSE